MYNSSVKFASLDVRNYLVSLGFDNLPKESLWNSGSMPTLAHEIIYYLASNLQKSDVWIKFEFILDVILNDEDFSEVFTKELGEYIGSDSFAESIVNRAKSGELMWSYDCVSLFKRMEYLHKKFINDSKEIK